MHKYQPLPSINCLPDFSKIQIGDIRYYNIKKRLFPGVTSILKDTRAFDMDAAMDRKRQRLIRDEGEKKANNTMDLPCKVGTYVHEQMELFAKKNILPLNSLAKHLIKYFEGVTKILACEIPVVHLVRNYAGTPDCIALTEDKKIVAIDFKTSAKAKYPSNLTEYYEQLAAYVVCLEEEYNLKVDECWILVVYKSQIGVKNPRRSDKFVISREELQPYVDSFLEKNEEFQQQNSTLF